MGVEKFLNFTIEHIRGSNDWYITVSTEGSSCEVLQKKAMNEDVSTADLAKEYTICGIVKKIAKMPGQGVLPPKEKTHG